MVLQETITVMMSSPTRPAPEAVEIPRQIGTVRLGELLGQGATGVVFGGYDELLRRRVAVKVLHKISGGDEVAELRRFVEGVRAAAAVKHPNIVTLHTVDTVKGLPLIVMEYVEGASLRELFAAGAAFDLSLGVHAMKAITAGIEALHDAQIVHRDLKPANIMFDHDGRTHVCDFGLACQLTGGSFVRGSEGVSGTPLYMAPEMFDGVVSPQSDVYALGAMLFEMLAGQPPFSAETMDEMRQSHLSGPVPVDLLMRRGIPEPAVDVVSRAMHKTRILRYKTAGHFLRSVELIPVPDKRDESLRLPLAALVSAATAHREQPSAAADQPGQANPRPELDKTTFDLIARRARAKRMDAREG